MNPINIYGKSKAAAERLIGNENPDALIVRTSAFFGPWDEHNFIRQVHKQLSQSGRFRVPRDIYVSPTYVPDLVNATLDLLIDDEKGIWHLANNGEVSWAELALWTAHEFNLNRSGIDIVDHHQMNFVAPRPLYSVLRSEKANLLPSLDNALERYFQQSNLYEQLLKTG